MRRKVIIILTALIFGAVGILLDPASRKAIEKGFRALPGPPAPKIEKEPVPIPPSIAAPIPSAKEIEVVTEVEEPEALTTSTAGKVAPRSTPSTTSRPAVRPAITSSPTTTTLVTPPIPPSPAAPPPTPPPEPAAPEVVETVTKTGTIITETITDTEIIISIKVDSSVRIGL